MKIAIAVPGRWSAFELAMALKGRGHEVALLTNYPKWIATKFGVDVSLVRSAWPNYLLGHVAHRINAFLGRPLLEPIVSTHYGHWAAGVLARGKWDVALLYSQFAEEPLRALQGHGTLLVVNKENSHIKEQAEVLEQEELRTGVQVSRPSPWAIAREEREYGLADVIRVVARYSQETFVRRGVPREKVWVNPSGAPIESFRPGAAVAEERVRRIRAGEPLRVIFVGAKVLRKGLWDLRTIVEALHGPRFTFRLVGPESPEARGVLRQLVGKTEVIPKQPQWKLPEQYEWADIYLLPSLEEGFPQTTAQARASGLPILTTPSGGGLEFVQEGKTGWMLPARDPAAFIEKLRWCDSHREELANMVESLRQEVMPRTWASVAEEFEKEVLRRLDGRRGNGCQPRP